MKFISSSTAPAAACGCPPRCATRLSSIIPRGARSVTLAPRGCATAASSIDARWRASMPAASSTFCDDCEQPLVAVRAASSSSPTTPDITTPCCTNSGVFSGSTLRDRLLAAVQPRSQSDRTSLETYPSPVPPQPQLPNPRRCHQRCRDAIQPLGPPQ